MAKSLTATGIEALKKKAASTGKRQTAFDARTPGLAVRATPTGTATFYVMTRDPAGKQRWAEIRDGNASVRSLAKARELAPQGLVAVKNGQTPYPKIEPAVEDDTYGKVVDRFIQQYAKPRQRTWRETARVLGLQEDQANPDVLKPIKGSLADPKKWGKRPIAEISRKEVDSYLSGLVEAEKKAAARVALSWLKTLWRWAWRRHLVDFPIMDALKAEDFGITRKSRDRFYADKEIKALWRAQSDKLTSRERAFIKLSILLGVRAGALAGMRKSEFESLEKPTLWTVPTERTKTRKSREEEGRVYLVPIPPLARRVLLPLLKGEGKLVFPSAIREGAVMDCGTPFTRKVREASGVADWTHHAHRHTLATWLQNQGHDEYDRALVLQHAGAGMATGGYSHGYSLDRARELLEKWANHIAATVSAKGVELLA